MAYNVHPYQRAHDASEYMTLDMNSLNPYNYKNMSNYLIPYQKQQDTVLFYKTIESDFISSFRTSMDGPI
jgi:hypothetical protein